MNQSDDRTGLGPQSNSDNLFRARIRRHQSWYRHEILKLPYGYGPNPGSTSYYGSMLGADAADAGLNFLTPEIHELAEKRIAQGASGVDPFRLRRNMLSSQPMCFNLFGLMGLDFDLGTCLAKSLWGDHIERVTAVRFEWAPTPKSEYLNDNTSFDAIVEYETEDGLGFVGIETKLADPFSRTKYCKKEYRRWMTSSGPWMSAAYPRCSAEDLNQLWRDHLLAVARLRHDSSKFTHGALTVIYHDDDEVCAESIATYTGLLQDDTTFSSSQLGEIVSLWRPHIPEWSARFEERYLSLFNSD